MQELLFITFALGIVALLTAFFRVYGKASSSPRKLLQTGVIGLAVLTLYILHGTTITAHSGLNVPLLIAPNGNGVLTSSDVLSMLSCAALGAMTHSYLYAFIRTPTTASHHHTAIPSTFEQSA